jgi:hypothetical protein
MDIIAVLVKTAQDQLAEIQRLRAEKDAEIAILKARLDRVEALESQFLELTRTLTTEADRSAPDAE